MTFCFVTATVGRGRHFLALAATLSLLLWHAPAEADEPGPASDELRAQTERMDLELRSLQRETRSYLYGWLSANAALAGAQASVALTTSTYATRGNYAVGTALAALGMGLLVLQPWPGLNAHARYRAMPAATDDQRAAKVEFAEQAIARQRRANQRAVGIDRHLAAAAIALAAGLGVGIGFDSMREGLSRALGVMLVLELQIVTRPGTYTPSRVDTPRRSSGWSLAPWIDRHVHGAAIAKRF